MQLLTLEELKTAIERARPKRAGNVQSIMNGQRFVWRALITRTGNRLKVSCRECRLAYGTCRCPAGGMDDGGTWRYGIQDKYLRMAAVRRWAIDPESLRALELSHIAIEDPQFKKLVWDVASELVRLADAKG